MNNAIAVSLVTISGLLAAISQLMLKKSAKTPHKSLLREYINLRVLSSYGILFSTTLINMFAMTHLPYKVMPALGTISYVFVVLFSKLLLKETFKRKKWIGVCLIILGILVFNVALD